MTAKFTQIHQLEFSRLHQNTFNFLRMILLIETKKNIRGQFGAKAEEVNEHKGEDRSIEEVTKWKTYLENFIVNSL